MQPVIKWSGSKHTLSEELRGYYPPAYERYFQPFLGSGAGLEHNRYVESYGSDIVRPLIDIWNLVKWNPDEIICGYRLLWENFQKYRADYYYKVRERFNTDGDPVSFLFLTRTCVNGLTRFNSKGEFNSAVAHTRPGIHPDRLAKILFAWREIVKRTTFFREDYKITLSFTKKGDFVFLDPPYMRTKGMYNGGINFEEFYKELEGLNSRGVYWLLTLDGDIENEPPGYKTKGQTIGALSQFRKVLSKQIKIVYDSIYANY